LGIRSIVYWVLGPYELDATSRATVANLLIWIQEGRKGRGSGGGEGRRKGREEERKGERG